MSRWAGDAAPPNTSLQLTLDVGGVGGAALWSLLSPAPCVTLGKSSASWASVSYSSLVRLHNRTDTAQVLGTGSGRCRVLLQVTESQQQAWEAPALPTVLCGSGTNRLGGPHSTRQDQSSLCPQRGRTKRLRVLGPGPSSKCMPAATLF